MSTPRGTVELPARPAGPARQVLPLWVAAVSLAIIAVVMTVGLLVVVHELSTAQASIVQLQQQVGGLQKGLEGLSGLGGLLGR